VRLFQQNLLADALDPSEGLEHEDWRSKLSQDYRRPTLKVSTWEASKPPSANLPPLLLIVLLVAWLFRITAFAPNESLLTTASIAVVPGPLVIAVIALYYIAMIAIVLWPRSREAKGEFREGIHKNGKSPTDNGYWCLIGQLLAKRLCEPFIERWLSAPL